MRARPVPLVLVAAAALPAPAHAASETLGRTTAEVRIVGADRAQGFALLRVGPGEPYKLREDLGGPKTAATRARQRRSVIYFAQLSDFQLADEESPLRVEVTDQVNSVFNAAWRPQEALAPFVIDASIRQVNAHVTSPITQGDGTRARLAHTLLTGDNADNQHRVEAEWVARLVEGGRLDPNTGSSDPADYASCDPGTPGPEEAARYTGVQDYDDYAESTAFYDPDVPGGQYAAWPSYPGLMDRAQQAFDTPGLRVPSYVALGNHDSLVQGNEDAIGPFDSIATGCRKIIAPSLNVGTPMDVLSATLLTSDPSKTVLVPPDPRRALISKPEYRRIFSGGRQADAHGFAFVDPAEARASHNAASYYDFSPVPGLRMITLDTVSDGGVTGPSADGNVDDPQYRWLEGRLKAATAADELVILVSHHAPVSLTADVPDELAQGCQTPEQPENDPNPGCDLDPRPSQPLHLGDEMVALAHRYPHVIAWVAGHSHVNDVQAYRRPGPVPAQGGSEVGGGFWVLRTSAEADWPHQDRLIEVMDNRDGTLSIFGTLIDNAAPLAVPPAGTAAAALDTEQLAAIGRTLGYNDPQLGGGTGEGDAEDHNVELLVPDPRTIRSAPGASVKPRLRITVRPRRVQAGRRTRLRFRVTAAGRPVRGARIRFAGRSARTDARGRARITVRLRRPGRRVVRVTLRGYRAARTSVRLTRR